MKCGIFFNSFRALLHRFIQHLVKRHLFSFWFLLCGISGRSQFVGSFAKRWTASVASRLRRGADKGFLAQVEP